MESFLLKLIVAQTYDLTASSSYEVAGMRF